MFSSLAQRLREQEPKLDTSYVDCGLWKKNDRGINFLWALSVKYACMIKKYLLSLRAVSFVIFISFYGHIASWGSYFFFWKQTAWIMWNTLHDGY